MSPPMRRTLFPLVCLAAALYGGGCSNEGEGSDPAAQDDGGARGPAAGDPGPPPDDPGPPPDDPGPGLNGLLEILPADFVNCIPSTPRGDGNVEAAECGPSQTQPGAQAALFLLYEDAATLQAAFTAHAAGLASLPVSEDCATSQGITNWSIGSDSGLLACTVQESGALILWTDEAALVEGVVSSPGSTQADLAGLYDWWTQHSAFQV